MTVKLIEGWGHKAAALGATYALSPSNLDYTRAGRGVNAFSVATSNNGNGANLVHSLSVSAIIGTGSTAFSSTTFSVGVAMYYDPVSSGTNGGVAFDGATNVIAALEGSTVHVAARINSSGLIELVRGTTVLATGTDTLVAANFRSAYNHWELTGTIDAAAGSVTCRLNGVVMVTVTGVNTKNGGTGVVNTFAFSYKGNSYGSTFSDGVRFTDLVVADTAVALGNNVVEYDYPSAAGDTTTWTPSTGTNWDAVNDLSSTDYVEGNASGSIDLYNVTDASTSYGTIIAEQVMVLAAKSDSGTPNGPLQVIQKGAAGATVTDSVVSAAVIGTGYAWYQAPIKETDPDGNAWTTTRFNALQVGVKVG